MRARDQAIQVENEVRIDNYLTAKLYTNGVIEIVWDTSINLIEPIHIKKMKEAVAELGGGRRMPLFFQPHEFLSNSSAGGEYAASDEGSAYTLASAVVVNNLAKKMLLNFFIQYNKPPRPTMGFTKREEAFRWLEKMKQAYEVRDIS